MIGRRSGWLLSVVIAVTIAPVLPFAQQTRDGGRPAAAPPAPSGTGALAGIVTNDDGSRPVRLAVVLALGITTGSVKVSSTDADGKFQFTGLPADRYIVGASKPPYLSMIAGARRPGRSGTPIALADAQKVTNLAIRLPMGAAITGVILDEKGRPSSNVQVAPYQWRTVNGERTPVSAGATVITDDLGQYRLFGLPPGEYLVAAYRPGAPPFAPALTATDVDAALRAGTAPVTPITTADFRYAGMFFPGTSRANEAAPVVVAAGDERANVNFTLQVSRVARVTGTVVPSEGVLPARLAVAMRTYGTPLVSYVVNASTGTDGAFVLQNVIPGHYVLTVNAGGQPPQVATATLDVNGADITGLQLMLRPGVRIGGTVMFHGTSAPPPLTGWRVPVRALGASGLPAPNALEADDSGAFTLANVYPGSYVIGGPQPFGPTNATVTWTLESVTVDGRDATDLPIEVTSDNPPQKMTVTFTDRWQELSGRLTRAGGAPASEYTVVVFPEDKKYWIPGSRRILTARPGTDGKFFLSAAGPNTLPAGKYLIAAVTDLERDEQYDPTLLTALMAASVPVTLQAGDKKIQDLMVK